MDKVQKAIVLNIIHHRQNILEDYTYLKLTFQEI
jgi:hypothetical protein